VTQLGSTSTTFSPPWLFWGGHPKSDDFGGHTQQEPQCPVVTIDGKASHGIPDSCTEPDGLQVQTQDLQTAARRDPLLTESDRLVLDTAANRTATHPHERGSPRCLLLVSQLASYTKEKSRSFYFLSSDQGSLSQEIQIELSMSRLAVSLMGFSIPC